MTAAIDPLIAKILREQAPEAQRIGAAVLAKLEAGAEPSVMDAARLMREAKELAVKSGELMRESREVGLRAMEFMDVNCSKTMWDANDLRELNPALAQEQLDINTRFQAASNAQRDRGELAHNARMGTYKTIGKLVAAEIKADMAQSGAATLPGSNFVIGCLAGGVVREKVMAESNDAQISRMTEFFRYAFSSHGKPTGVDFYQGNYMAAAIGKDIGLKTAKEARGALVQVLAAEAQRIVAEPAPPQEPEVAPQM